MHYINSQSTKLLYWTIENSPNFLQLTLGARAPHSKESPILKCCWVKKIKSLLPFIMNKSHYFCKSKRFWKYLFLAVMYDMMFWLKNFRMRGMQLANTRCWAMYSNYNTSLKSAASEFMLGILGNTWERCVFFRNGALRVQYLVDVVEFEVFEQQQQDGRDRLHNDLFVSIHVDTEFHALQHCGPAESETNHLIKCSLKRFSWLWNSLNLILMLPHDT